MGKNHFEKIMDFYGRRKRMPSYSEIMGLLGFKSKNAVTYLVQKLIEEGAVKKDNKGRLIPTKLFNEIPVLGTIEAGWPSPAEEELLDTMTLDEFLISNKEATSMITVSGDSMKDAGILSGDLVLVERKNDAKDGQIVIAEIDDKWTMKYYRKRGKEIYLEAANSKFGKIVPKNSLKIAAVVKVVIRKYK